MYLTSPAAASGSRVADTFRGRRRFVRFMEAVQLEFGICFTTEEWERGFRLDDLVRLVGEKMRHPRAAQRLARKRLEEARATLRGDPLKFGIFTAPLLLAAFASHPVVKVLPVVLWFVIVAVVVSVTRREYRYARELVRRVEPGGREQGAGKR